MSSAAKTAAPEERTEPRATARVVAPLTVDLNDDTASVATPGVNRVVAESAIGDQHDPSNAVEIADADEIEVNFVVAT